jgi:hypothetical protein
MEPKYGIYILTTAQRVLSESLFLCSIPNSGQITIPAFFFYIEGADPHIFVDTGGSGQGLRENSQFGVPWEDVSSFEENPA